MSPRTNGIVEHLANLCHIPSLHFDSAEIQARLDPQRVCSPNEVISFLRVDYYFHQSPQPLGST